VTFKKEVYAEVEQDESFTTTAWIIVVVVSIIAALGGISFAHFAKSLLGVLISAVLNVIGFAVGALVMNLVGRALFKADVTFEEIVRTVGLAYVWNAVSILNVLGGLAMCFLWPVTAIAWVALVVSLALAIKEALDLDWVPTIVTVVLGWIAIGLAYAAASGIRALIGIVV
jgi:hypothetical protein